MVLNVTAVLLLCPWGGGSGAVTTLPTRRTRKPPITSAAITSRLRMPASDLIGGAVTGRLALHPDADPGPADHKHHGRHNDQNEQCPEGLREHRPPEPGRGARRHPEHQQGRGPRAEAGMA